MDAGGVVAVLPLAAVHTHTHTQKSTGHNKEHTQSQSKEGGASAPRQVPRGRRIRGRHRPPKTFEGNGSVSRSGSATATCAVMRCAVFGSVVLVVSSSSSLLFRNNGRDSLATSMSE
mmetsp:Transcript_116019/g.237234  ORF Transcript_116019/g.237234 Transcript_116019/m.237234 type:complete len:117 (+) Transcript_116019:1131-1481(+)